jgi:hypothetical protein
MRPNDSVGVEGTETWDRITNWTFTNFVLKKPEQVITGERHARPMMDRQASMNRYHCLEAFPRQKLIRENGDPEKRRQQIGSEPMPGLIVNGHAVVRVQPFVDSNILSPSRGYEDARRGVWDSESTF